MEILTKLGFGGTITLIGMGMVFIGLIILIAFTGVGFLAAGAVLSGELYMSLLGLSEPTMVYVAVVGVCAFIGLLICLTLVMNGLIYNRVCKNSAALRRIVHH